MSVARPFIDEVIPSEFRAVAEHLFPETDDHSDGAASELAAARFAATLGVGEEYERCVLAQDDRERADRRLLAHFRNNVELLVQKTWVEKADEAHKEKLLDRLPLFVADMEAGDYSRALKTFVHIADELAYLLFGSQSRKGDFIEYVSRIDSQMGLFWWYAGAVSSLLGEEDAKRLRAILLVGVCFLAGF
jgi:hypothetical protein